MVQPAFDASDFTLTKGIPKVYIHISEGSGKEIYVNFCNNCGTKLFQTFERFQGAVGVYRGTLDYPNWLEMTSDNSKHIFLNVAQSETMIPAHIPVFKEHAAQNDGTPIAPIVFEEPQKIGVLKQNP